MSNTLLVFDGTPEQEAAAQTLWETATFPRGFLEGRQVKLTFMPNMIGGKTGRAGHIVLGDGLAPTDVGFIMLHEIGHLADFWCLDDADRQLVLDVQGFAEWDKLSWEGWCNGFATTYQPPGSGYPHYPLDNDLVRELMNACGEGENMVSSEQIRKWYHQGVVLNHDMRNTPGYKPICEHNHPKVEFPNNQGGVFFEPVHPLTVGAWEAYVRVMKDMGVTMSSAGGVNHCRNIAGTDMPSLHAYICAVDLPPNDYKTQEFIDAIAAIRTNSGAQVFRTLEGDRMHDQINCSPADLATGIKGDNDMAELSPEAQKFYEEAWKAIGSPAATHPPSSPLEPKSGQDILKALAKDLRRRKRIARLFSR